MSSEVTGSSGHVSESADGGLFTRQATGLVRQVSPFSATVFNALTAPFPFVLALAIFWTFGAFPGGNLYVAFIAAYGLGIVFAFAIGLLATAIPRSGGDYVLVGRTIHPVVGLISSFCFTAGVLVSIAFLIVTVVTAAIGPCLVVVGQIGNHQTLVDWGSTVETSQNWQFGVGLVALLICTGIVGSGWKWGLRFQNWGFAFGMFGMLVAAILLLMNSGKDFISAFNKFAQPSTGKADSYHYLIQKAQAAGIDTHASAHFSNTFPLVGAVMGFCMYAWFSAHIGGEVRRASTWRMTLSMVSAAVFNLGGVLLFTLLFTHAFGKQFFTAINALNGSPDYPFKAPPFYVFLTSIAGGSELWAWVMGLSFLTILMLVLWLNLVQPVRALFAYSFDGVLPLRIAQVSGRTQVPLAALGITFVISAALYAWAVYGSSLFAVYATAVIITVVALILLAISAIILPYRRPEVWRSSVTNKRIGGVPLITIAGVFALAAALINGYVFIHYSGLGLAHPNDAYRNILIICVAAVAVYYIASAVRSRQGISLAKATAEIPPE